MAKNVYIGGSINKIDYSSSSYGEQIKVSTENGSIVMCVLGDDFEFVHMNIREAKKLRDILNEAIKKVI